MKSLLVDFHKKHMEGSHKELLGILLKDLQKVLLEDFQKEDQDGSP